MVVSEDAPAEADPVPAAPPPHPWIVGVLVIAWAALIAMEQFDRLIGDVVVGERQVFRLTDATGLTPWVALDAWPAWAADTAGPALNFIEMYTVVDAVFIACYAVLLVALVNNLTVEKSHDRRVYTGLVIWVVAADVLEDVIVVVLTCVSCADPPGPIELWSLMQAVATGIKWLATAVLLGFAIFGNVLGVRIRRFLKNAVAGLYAQRLGLIVVAGFSYLALTSGGDLAEQVPDIYRGWLDLLHPEDQLSHGILHALFTAMAGAAVFLGLVYFGRQRGRRYYLGRPNNLPRANLRGWAATGAALLLLGPIGAIAVAGWFFPIVDPITFWSVIAVMMAVAVISCIIRHRFLAVGQIGTLLPQNTGPLAPATFRVGDVLAVTWLAAGLLAPFAAMVPVLALRPMEVYKESWQNVPLIFVAVACFAPLALAVVLPTIAWKKLRSTLAPVADAPPDGYVGSAEPTQSFTNAALVRLRPTSVKPPFLRRLETVFLILSIGTVVLFATFPIPLGVCLGPLATVVLLLGAQTGIAGVIILKLGERRPPEVFRLLRLRATPVVALAILLPIAVASVQAWPVPHAIQLSEDLRMPKRLPLAEAYDEWKSQACVVDTAEGKVKPLILVAAEGGGIRAATWTVDVLAQLFDSDSKAKNKAGGDCAAKAVFMSSGASGGSVGLAMLATTAETDRSTAKVVSASGPDALGANVAALLSSESITAITGLRPELARSSPSAGLDRAAIQENVWAADAEFLLNGDFDATLRPGTGYAIFNSTDAVSNCKVVISQMDLSTAGSKSTGKPSQCVGPDATLTNSIDLIDTLGDQECKGGMTWSTTSFLSARFPFVSPSGRLPEELIPEGCTSPGDVQLLDGGLLDNSALGTVSDLMPQLLAEIRSPSLPAPAGKKASAEDTAKTGTAPAEDTEPVVVPLVLWVSNGPGSDVLAASGRARPEWVAPIVTLMSAKGAQVEPAAWLSRIADQLTPEGICGGSDTECLTKVRAIQTHVDNGIVVASQATEPATSVPLGWSLSWFSRTRLNDAAGDQAACPSRTSTLPGCGASGDYAPLGSLLSVFKAADAP